MKTPRLLRYPRKRHLRLEHNQPHNLAAEHALMHFASGAVFSFIPKNACTTLRYSLALANGMISGPDDFHWIHSNNQTFNPSLRELVTAPYTGIILRCPHARLASVFLDKIVTRTRDAWTFSEIDRTSFDLENGTFRQFATLMQNPVYRNCNIHFRHQMDFAVYEQYDSWFTLSDFAELEATIKERTGLVLQDTRALMKHSTERFDLIDGDFADTPLFEISEMKSRGKLPSHTSLYNSEIVDIVRKAYTSDFVMYDRNIGKSGLMFPTT